MPEHQSAMMPTPLLTSDIIENAILRYPEQRIVSLMPDGHKHEYSYIEAHTRIKKLANALSKLGFNKGDRIGTLANNHYRHFELYYAIGGSGAVIHTLNPRLFEEQLEYIIKHAEDEYIFVDPCFIPLLENIQSRIPKVKAFIINCFESEMQSTQLAPVYCYETLLDKETSDFDWPKLKGTDNCGLCYTSGTTGNPKGVIYDHQSSILHAMMSGSSQFLSFNEWDIIMPAVPMYHVVAWGIPYSAPLFGSKLVFCGDKLDGESLYHLIDSEQVNKGFGVPTIWLGLHNYLDILKQATDLEPISPIPSLKMVGVGGAASPTNLVKAYSEKYDVYWMGLWGMTETSPLMSASVNSPSIQKLDPESRYHLQSSAGKAMFGTQIEIFDQDNQTLAHDGIQQGILKVKGPWVLKEYFKGEGQENFEDGWFNTGDIAVINPEGYLRIVDRAKDVIKSGGEWISSVQLEDAALEYASINEACVIGVTHPKWDERPILLVTIKPGKVFEQEALITILKQKVAKWWLPDAILQLESLPHTGTGKLKKIDLRNEYKDYLIDKIQ